MRQLLWLAMAAALLAGCESKLPEEDFLGTQHWVLVRDGVNYDLGSVRRMEHTVMFNFKYVEDVLGLFRPVSQENRDREARGQSLVMSYEGVMILDCRSRSALLKNVVFTFSDGQTVRAQIDERQTVSPNSAIEEILTTLCV